MKINSRESFSSDQFVKIDSREKQLMAKFSNFFQFYDEEENTNITFCMHVSFLFKNLSKSKIITENVFITTIRKN